MNRANELAQLQGKYNKEVRAWSKMTKAQLIRNLQKLNINQKGELLQRMNTKNAKYSKNDGSIFRVRFPITKGGIMTAKGVGRGDTSNRKAKDWYATTLDMMTEALADTAQEHYGDTVTTKIKY